MSPLTLLYSPFPNIESARGVSGVLLNAGCVACCNLLSGAESHYIWQGVPTTSNETILIAKTTPEMAARAYALIAEHHPYECPAILSFDAEANPEFTAWVHSSLAPPKKQ